MAVQKLKIAVLSLFVFSTAFSFDINLVRLKYDGGDWYNDPNCLSLLSVYCNKNTPLKIDTAEIVYDLKDKSIRNHPFLFMTGHGGLKYDKRDIENIREYLLTGGFLYIDDDYGFNKDIRRFLSEMFPERKLVRIGIDNLIFNSFYKFEKIPKIHEHYEGPPEVYAIFINKKISVLYTYNTNISDGWALFETYKDSDKKREDALKMGVNFIYYAIFK